MPPLICLVDLNSDPPLELLKSFREFLPKDKENALIFAAFEGNLPIGMISAYLYSGIKEALVACIRVIPEKQNKGIGSALMLHLVEHFKSLDLRILNFQYNSWEQSSPYLEKILKKTEWEPPVLLTRRYFFHPHTFHPDWFISPLPQLPKNFSLFPWAEAQTEEEAVAKFWVQTNPQVSQYSPFDPQYPIDTTTSLGIRHKNQLSGWMINHRLNPKLLRYSAFYVIPEIRGLGPGVCMLKESIRLHIANAPDLEGMIEINFRLSSPSWIRFVKMRLAPFASKVEDIRYAFHFLR